MVRQSRRIVQNLVVNYHLVISYPQQCHTGVNVSHGCHYNRNTHNVAFCIFSYITLNNFHKLLVIIVICNEKHMN